MTHLKLQVGDIDDPRIDGSLSWVTIDLSVDQFAAMSDDQLLEQYMKPAILQLIWNARENLKRPPEAALPTALQPG